MGDRTAERNIDTNSANNADGGEPVVNGADKYSSILQQRLMNTVMGQIDLTTPEGINSISLILGQCVENGVQEGIRLRGEELRKKEEERVVEKQKRRDEKRQAGDLSPASIEKKKRREERDEVRREQREAYEREQVRQTLPLIRLSNMGIPHDLAYPGLQSTMHNILVSTFSRGTAWGTLDRTQKTRIKGKVKAAFRNGYEIDDEYLSWKLRNSMSQMNYHDRSKVRTVVEAARPSTFMDLRRPVNIQQDVWDSFYKQEVSRRLQLEIDDWTEKLTSMQGRIEVGELSKETDLGPFEQKIVDLEVLQNDTIGAPEPKFMQAMRRLSKRPKVTHKLGRGGLPRLKFEFLAKYQRRISREEAAYATRNGRKALYRQLDEKLKDVGSEDSEDGDPSSDDDFKELAHDSRSSPVRLPLPHSEVAAQEPPTRPGTRLSSACAGPSKPYVPPRKHGRQSDKHQGKGQREGNRHREPEMLQAARGKQQETPKKRKSNGPAGAK